MNLIELKDILNVLKKYTRMIIITVIIFTVLGAVFSYLIPPVFQAKSDLLVNYSYSKTDVQEISVNEIDTNLRLIETYKYILTSDRVLEKVAEEMGNIQTVEDLAKQISVETNTQSQIITITVQDSSYLKAEKLANATALIFQKEIQNLMKINNVQILTEAKKSIKAVPIKPNHLIYTVLAFLLGITVSIITVFLKETMFATTDSIERVEKNLQLPVLGFVPKISLRTKVNHQKLTSDHLHSKTLPQIRNNIPVIESYREIRSNLQHAINQEQLKTFLFTSPNPGEGKSLTAGNVAICMAMDGKRVVYVDSDLRKGVGSFLFNLPAKKGLTTYLEGRADLVGILQTTEIPNLSFISKGADVYNQVELLASKKMEQFLEQLKEEFDVIIMDCPSLIVMDAVSMATKVDGSILVVHAKKTKSDHVLKSMQTLQKAQAHIQGLIINYGKINNKKKYYE
ncbi:polysaccharide biosynthesis tyrosine autokinase [Bacillus paranthracis]|nr:MULTISPECIES: polysaccharide biosynthesis tyrosine autokinase [Bacillus]HDR7931571.1 polysaccharide biosynthesis tyrosine autokinase [Bacillus pacificus]MCC2342360.1 polysaccharide biosynthesis tyrosine autokinase [Bacillus tropicus]MCU5612301.1 polysaccharide biosynthesis tyrosine autokinase [Bacillus paranthracis]MDA1829659.1 polysaccharide biosynthesis tyrosine autokinase [Bacillus cereus group sp. BY25LC]MDX5864185.1 polysaccharide biosynthesis tyrosine autokinase [Bacillus cereus group